MQTLKAHSLARLIFGARYLMERSFSTLVFYRFMLNLSSSETA
ncbi:hypothetical protein CLAC_09320 [Corynebacterium lactis RW2-5]|uniref:Transposase n=1 Tax=Corynebacterium lactis RW2-5 TaxID=1408189 RepID=A0A0K2H3L9_9CORY|nr:hypothetical protein CLAC_09320 [Corynebacterium lactis RW2-5]